jgi:hypothetical protein
VAYIKCRCKECRFYRCDWCPEAFDSILDAYERHYPTECLAKYATAAYGGGAADEEVYFNTSQCLIIQAMREREQVLKTLWPQFADQFFM